MTLEKYLNLTSSGKRSIDKYSQRLYEITGGHPRTLVEVLTHRCDRIKLEHVPPEMRPFIESEHEHVLSDAVVSMIRKTALRFSTSASILLAECYKETSNILHSISVDGIRYKDLLPSLRIGYRNLGNGKTQLTIPQPVRVVLEGLLTPLFDFLVSVARAGKSLPINYSQAMEMVIAKGFMDWFSEEQDTRRLDIPRRIFGSTKLMQWEGFFCSKLIRAFSELDAERIDVFMETNQGANCWLVTSEMSNSPDLIHVSVYNSHRSIIMIAVKNYAASSKLSESGIIEEIHKASPMVPSGCEAVLVIAATQYTKDIQSRFKTGVPSFVLQNVEHDGIDQVIVLDLTSEVKRASLFRVTTHEEAAKGLELIVRKTRKSVDRISPALDSRSSKRPRTINDIPKRPVIP